MLQEKSFASVKLLALNREQLLDKLIQITHQLVNQHPEVLKVVLIGSLARGDQVGTSDVDIVVIVKEKPRDYFDHLQRYLSYFDLPIGVDMLLFSQDDVTGFEKSANPFWKIIEKEGIILT